MTDYLEPGEPARLLAWPVEIQWEHADYGTRYGKPRREPKLPRKLKKRYGRLSAWAFHVSFVEVYATPAVVASLGSQLDSR